jgi:hypothetical protein
MQKQHGCSEHVRGRIRAALLLLPDLIRMLAPRPAAAAAAATGAKKVTNMMLMKMTMTKMTVMRASTARVQRGVVGVAAGDAAGLVGRV